MAPKPNTNCANCGNPTYRPPKRIAAGETITCSIACRKELTLKRLARACEWCGRTYIAERIEQRFCDGLCSGKYAAERRKTTYPARPQLELVCDQCGITFARKVYDQERNPYKYGTFCSRKCAAKRREKAVTIHCPVCNKPVRRTIAQFKRSRNGRVFCCRKHAVAWNLLNGGMNNLETDFLAMFPNLQFVGDGTLWLWDDDGCFNPDFLLPNSRKVIELFGDWWHRDQDPQDRINRCRAVGYDCLVVWESKFRQEPETVQQTVLAFLSSC